VAVEVRLTELAVRVALVAVLPHQTARVRVQQTEILAQRILVVAVRVLFVIAVRQRAETVVVV